LDAQKKTLEASERREEERVHWREQMKQVDAKRLVIVDESGSTIALTPLYARARHPGNELMAVSHQSRRQKYRFARCLVSLRDRSLHDHRGIGQCARL
jgi:hypothetical protein